MTTRKADILISQKKKDECNAKAQRIVCELIDWAKTEEEFLEHLRWVNQSHYQDIVEERAISKVCGYPLCDEELSIIPRKQYHISVSLNKVYDITERKLFCSNQCYKASMYLKMQLHTSPLWLGDREKTEAFTLLKSRTELMGDEIKFGIERVRRTSESTTTGEDEQVEDGSYTYKLREDLDFCIESTTTSEDKQVEAESCTYSLRDDLEFYVDDDMDSEEENYRNEIGTEKLNQPSKLERMMEKKHRDIKLVESNSKLDSNTRINKTGVSNKFSSKIHVNSNESITEKDQDDPKRLNVENTESNKLNKTKTSRPKGPTQSIVDLIKHVEQSMREWITVESLRLILGDKTVTSTLGGDSSVVDTNSVKSEHEHGTTLPKKLQTLVLDEEEEPIELADYELPSKPLPDFEMLKKQTEEMEIKVREFYRGDTKKVTFAEDVKETTPDDDSIPVILPPVHHHAQNAIRRKIVLSKLNLVLPDTCDLFALNRVDTCSKVKQLIHTCRLSAHNITFKPVQWNLITLILLKLLSVEDESVRTSMLDKSRLIATVLMSYQLESNYLDLIISRLTNPVFIFANESTSTS